MWKGGNKMFADKLKELRKKKGVTQAQLADAIYVSRSLIAKFETGASYPNKDTLEKIALYFGISVSELIGTDETVLIAVENKNLTQRIEFWSLVVILAVAFVFAIMVLFRFSAEAGMSIQFNQDKVTQRGSSFKRASSWEPMSMAILLA